MSYSRMTGTWPGGGEPLYIFRSSADALNIYLPAGEHVVLSREDVRHLAGLFSRAYDDMEAEAARG